MITKHYGKDFYSHDGGLILGASDVSDKPNHHEYKYSSRKHESGWVISGTPVEGDSYDWVHEFEATHERYGRVWGNFEHQVFADTEEGFNHFYANHPPAEHDL